jgi:GDPmannose 4,6-dehydratase
MTKRALITGISGQDGIYLAEWLLAHEYAVHGLSRCDTPDEQDRLASLADAVTRHPGDLTDQASLVAVVKAVRPHEIYNLGAQSFVPASWTDPVITADITGLGAVRMLQAIREVDPAIRLCQASSSEIFGNPREVPQTEVTPFNPRSPYGSAKAYAHMVVQNFREHHGLFAVNAILYNHESPRRGLNFVTRKITDAAARIKLGLATNLHLGNLDGQRDWGFAGDYVRALWMMLQQDTAEDFVIATGTQHSVRDCCEIAFAHLGLDYRDFVVVDPRFVRVGQEPELVGDASKARARLGWVPEVGFDAMIRAMVEHDLARHRPEATGAK